MNVSAASRGYLQCALCAQVNVRPASLPAGASLACARCRNELHARKPHSVARTWALVIAAYGLYVPANLLPVLETSTVGQGAKWDTILSGVFQLVRDDAWPLALVLLVASIGVPLAKLLALTYLLVSVQVGSTLHRHGRTRMVRLLEAVGRWSMVDIYVGGLLVSLVQFEPLVSISPGPGAIAFGAVVVLTVMASRSFDPRLIWDAAGQAGGEAATPAEAARA
jgi:paraquat-inducible protein A